MEEQIAYALIQESTGQMIAEICRMLGVPEQTFHRWTKNSARWARQRCDG